MTRRASLSRFAVPLVTSAACLLASGCPSGEGHGGGGIARVSAEGLVKVVTADKPKVLDPHVTSNGGDVKVLIQIYETLLEVDPQNVNRLVPCLAESWEVAADGLTITFHLRKNVRFHDGAPLDAAAVKLSLDRMRQVGFELPSAPYATEFEMVEEFVAKGDVLEVKLRQPAARVALRNLSMFCACIVSPKVLEATRSMPAAEASTYVTKHAAGTGPYRPDAFDPAANVTRLSAFADYWGGAPQVKTLVFEPVADESTRFERFKLREPLLVDDVPRQHWAGVEADPEWTLHAWWAQNVCYLGLNATHAATQDEKLRHAIQLAVERERIVEHYEGTARATFSLVAQSMADYDPTYRVDGWSEDAEARQTAAASLVAEAGATGRSLTIYFPKRPRPYLPRPQDVANTLSQQLDAIGLHVNIQGVENSELFSSVASGKYELVLIGWMSDNGDPDNFYSPLADGTKPGEPSENNTSRVVDAEVHAKLVAAREQPDGAQRVNAYREVERLLQTRVRGYVPLANTQEAVAFSRRLEGVEIDELGHYRFRKARLVK